jgi:hypothetical protein
LKSHEEHWISGSSSQISKESTHFIIEYRVNIFYRGQTKFEFKEGETLVLTGYLPDRNDKTKMIGTEYLTKHSMDGNLW